MKVLKKRFAQSGWRTCRRSWRWALPLPPPPRRCRSSGILRDERPGQNIW